MKCGDAARIRLPRAPLQMFGFTRGPNSVHNFEMPPRQSLDPLRQELAKGNVLVVAGSGVSLQATRGATCAGWLGLILNGIDYCVNNGLVSDRKATFWRDQAGNDDLSGRLQAADRISSALGAPDGGEFRSWLQQSLGRLEVVDGEIIDSIHGLGTTIATTNYDTLLSRGRGIEAIPWTDSAAALEILRGDRQGILHLYGHYDRPESVVLGAFAYTQLRASLVAQTVQQMAALSRTLLFIGCGDGLGDPNLGELFAWSERLLHNTIYRHYCLCRAGDREWLQSRVAGNRLVYIEYGDDYLDLAPFLRELARQRRSLPKSQVTVAPSATSRSEERMGEDRVDVGIVVALVEEFRELHRLLPPATPHKDYLTGTSDYLFEYPMKNGGSYRCAATFVGVMGPTEAALATERFLNRCNPATVVMLGIAAGIHDDVKLGDVIVAQHVGRYLDRAKIVDGVENFDIRAGGDSFSCSADLVRAALELEFADRSRYEAWIEEGRTDLAALVKAEQRDALLAKNSLRNEPQFVAGQVASGPVVAASKKFVKWVKSTNRNYLALEMEGGAMLAAVYSRAQPKQSLMLRGISDFGDQRKRSLDAIGKGGLRRYAMRNATKMLWALMDAGVLPHGTTNGVMRADPPQQAGPLPLRANHDASIRIKRHPEADALGIWKEKLAFLRRQEAILSDAAQLFTLRMQIEEAEQHIASLEQ